MNTRFKMFKAKSLDIMESNLEEARELFKDEDE